jgi:hypothetical protein
MKRQILKPMYECRCNGRLQTKRFTRLAQTHFVYYESIKRELKDKQTGLKKSLVYLQQIKKKAKAEGKTCHAKTMLSLEKPIKLL